MRKVDYTGSQPVASKLLFAPARPGSEDELKSDMNAFEMAGDQSYLHHRGAADQEPNS
ncbi:hypothetical protein FA13DRAFT_1735457 [Coprinellus micaceus]|uniref:Uncharacterized protein n=1 Tax=Coprinellus micaceus TaxID=71717 RepID=A0A4Y7T4Z0_COPMI|nr:hypothetical protein FA13DRAFT_1735457 [Coprinellus micaceus]